MHEVISFEILPSFMNLEGNIAYGRVWKFFLQVQDEKQNRVSTLRLAALLASSRSTHYDSTSWVTQHACLSVTIFYRSRVYSFFFGGIGVSSGKFFPRVYNVKALTEVCLGLEFSRDPSKISL